MKQKIYSLPLFLLLVMSLLGAPLVSGVSAGSDDVSVCNSVRQRGEVKITIPAGETNGTVNLLIPQCEEINLQVTGGSMLNTPIIINGSVNQNLLTIRASLTELQPGPVDATVWWQLN